MVGAAKNSLLNSLLIFKSFRKVAKGQCSSWFREFSTNSLLIPCSKTKYSNFGRNSITLELIPKNSLHISLFFILFACAVV